ncbi:similar to Saccharomyces cerevisiae YJL204C RCY1 F-box protein involved in recycling plasma membrane proteins internalized by endocytosis [Maudiozyma saulgeensis]|uniref:Similar to Saccharomyces cerevisiae YJL204C RCY1 F-box protein involved in recycling plasma membrane proteins internalized by endocytosis n=1 Tax=Maudiozyma saulgeensis TaxID=1789683 RepID=A0A1X7R1L2_9SACH|nr:similar to Saccharomyces cerevisiae YJL204C RCY1 F-box protein involved in recycling plasma membrane proteins internalized by endocytosis [Kazachstania saulgeensis]
MDNILQVEDIVKNIVANLNAKDYINFKCTSKKVYNTWISKETDYIYFSNKLKQIGLDEESIEEPSENKLIDDVAYTDITVINAFEKIKIFNKQNYLTIYKVLYQTFNDYCENLYTNKLANFFPVQYESDPLQQSQILQNIIRFNVSNNNDFEYFTKVVTNFNILKEIFINSCLNEMEINYNETEYAIVGKFTKVLLTFGEQNMVIDFFNSKIEYPSPPSLPTPNVETTSKTTDTKTNSFSDEELIEISKPLKEFVKKNINVIDLLFEENYPMFTNFFETFIQQSLIPFTNEILKDNGNEDTFINEFPLIYSHIIEEFCTNLSYSINGSMNEDNLNKEQRDKLFHERVYDLLNVYLQPNILKYLDQSSIQFEKNILKQFNNFQIEQKEKSENEILNLTAENSTIDLNENQNKNGDKYNFLDSFTKVFGISSKTSKAEQMNDNLTSLMNNSLRNIKNLINLELCLTIVRQTQTRIDIFLQFKASKNLTSIINEKCENIFRILIKCLNENHIQPAYEKAISLLQSYDINDLPINDISKPLDSKKNATQSVEPLVNFAELINTSDIILQMISIFYRSEMVTKKIIDPTKEAKKNIFESGLLQTKKNFESTVDNFVADGLNIGINKLVDQINHTFKTVQLPTDYYPPTHKNTVEIKPTECCRKTVTLLDNHCFLLNGATDKGTIDVYQQEIGKRFFNILVEHLKTQIISTEGAIILICDMNLYFDFFNQKLKQKSIIPYFQALKNVSNLFLIDGKDSKELGKLIGDLNKFQGIFSQEEIYEFVQRRQDWLSVKRDVEKVMYGLGLKDCVLM